MRGSGLVFLFLWAAACTGDIDGVVSTDFGDAVATSQRTESGDIESWLSADDAMLAQLHWDAESLGVDASLAEAALPFSGPADLAEAELADLNLFLYALWEVERDAPDGVTCVENAIAICCRGDAWSCATRVK